MKIIESSAILESIGILPVKNYKPYILREFIYKHIEEIGRVCYKSEHKIEDGSAFRFVKMLNSNGHNSVFDHVHASVRFICDRGISHELVRHRLTAISQESTRYCNYSKDQFNNQLQYIDLKDHFKENSSYLNWKEVLDYINNVYVNMVDDETAQIARSILPNSLKTELVMTADLTEWKHILKARTSIAAHPQMREIMIPLLDQFIEIMPEIYIELKGK